MSDDNSGFDTKYVSTSATTATSGSQIEDTERRVIIKEDNPAALLKMEDSRYGLGKPKRIVIRGKISV